MISPLIPAEDFARQLTPGEFEALTNSSAAMRRVTVCAVVIDGIDRLRSGLGDARVDALVRELVVLVRRMLRGADAVLPRSEDLLLFLDVSSPTGVHVVERILQAVRAHGFASGAPGPAIRVTASVGVASSPEHGASFLSLSTAARECLRTAPPDSVTSAFETEERPLNLNRLMGGHEQLVQLTDALDNSVRGSRHVVAMIGESGLGASTLLRALEPEVRLRGGSLVTGTCYERRLPVPYSLWSDVLRAVRRLPVKTTRQWQELPLLDGTLERDSAPASASGKTRLLEEIADFVRLSAQQRPLVLVLENLQWCDDASWDALEYLIAQLERERVLIVLTMEDGSAGESAIDRWHRIGRGQRHHEIRLGRLTREDVKRWLESTLRGAEISREVMTFVYRQSEGRPLVLTHLLRDLEEGGHLVWSGSAWHWSAIHEFPPVGSFVELISRRVQRLKPGPRELLDVASILVREGDEVFLAGIGAGRRRGEFRELVDAGFLRPTFDRARAAYVISHFEVARVVQGLQSPARFAELSGRVARGLASDVAPNAAEVAEHFENAGNNVLAHRYALEATDRAAALHETLAVLTLLAAAEQTAPNDEALADVRVRMVAMAEVAGRLEEAETYCDKVLPWFESRGDRTKALRLKSQRARLRMQRGHAASDTLELLLSLEQEAQEVGADSERAQILLLISQIHWRLGDFPSARRVAAQCVEIAERGSDNLLICDAFNRLGVTVHLDDPEEARRLYNRSRAAAMAAGDASRLVRVLNNIGLVELNSYNWAEAERMMRLAAEQARTAGLLLHWARAELNLGVLAGRIGNYEAAQVALAEALRLSSVMQNSEDQVYAMYNMAQVEFERGNYPAAADTYELVIDLSARIEQVEVQAGAFGGLGTCRFLMGDLEGAAKALESATPFVARLDGWFQGRELVEATRIHLSINRHDLAAAADTLTAALSMVGSKDAYASAWLSAEFGRPLLGHLSVDARAALTAHADHPEVTIRPALMAKLGELKLYGEVGVDG